MAYTEPTRTDLRTRYPAFTAVADATVDYWLTDAHRYVDQSWAESDYAPTLIDVAAHFMTRSGAAGITGSDVSGFVAAGVSEFRSGGQGGFQAKFSDEAIKASVAGGFDATEYGRSYLTALAKNKSGGTVSTPGTICYPYPYAGYGYL